MRKAFWIAFLLLSAAHAATTATAAEADGPWRKTLPDGSVVEVVGVSTCPSGPKTWWKPDGTPLDAAPYKDPMGQPSPLEAGAFAREFAVRLTTADEGAKIGAKVVNDHRGSTGRNALSETEGRLTTFVLPEMAVFAAGKTSCSIRCWGGVGPWRTEAENRPGTMGSHENGRGHQIFFTGAHELANGRVLVVASAVMKDDPESRVVAVDRSGTLQTCHFGQSHGNDDLYQHVDEFKLKLADIKTFLFQTRPRFEAQFADVALHPRAAKAEK